MQVTEVTILISGTVQPRSFENIKREMTVKVELGEGDDLETVAAKVMRSARWALADSFVGEFQARFDATVYYRLDSKEELRDRMLENSIFETISANAPDIGEFLVEEYWETWEAHKAEETRKEAEREAAKEAQRRERETAMAIAQLAGVDVIVNDDDDNLGGVGDIVPDDAEEETAEADYDDDFDLSDPDGGDFGDDEDDEDDESREVVY